MIRSRIIAAGAMLALAAAALLAGPNRFGFSDRIERHMFPEVTTGPAEPTWSPDGRWIAFSMQGDIWKVPAAGGEAIALTRGPAYHFEPDWSPDGQWIALTMDVGGNLEIGVVSADGGDVEQLTDDRGADLGPAWAPDSRSVFFVSSRARGFDIYRVGVGANDRHLGAVVTGAGDQIQPAVSPDGKTLAYVSPVPGRLGTGGIWTRPLEAGPSDPALILYEESEYRMRPRWTPDGKALVFGSDEQSSNGISIVAAAGGNAVVLTADAAGEFSPAVSPDGTRVAFISNRTGPMTLFTVPIGGGPISAWTPVKISSLRPRIPTGRVTVRLRSGAAALAGRVMVRASDGRAYAPAVGFARVISATETHYFHTTGEFTIEVPGGPLEVEAMSGFERRPARTTIDVRAGATHAVTLTLDRAADPRAGGWYSGDTHAHDLHQGRFGLSHRTLFEQSVAEDLHVTNVLIHMDGTRLMGRWPDLTGEPHPLSTRTHLMQFAEEFRGSLGHIGMLGISRYILPLTGGAGSTPYDSIARDSPYLDGARAQGGIAGFMHPYLNAGTNPAGWAGSLIPVDVALGKGEFYDVASVYSDELASAEMYYKLLNCGFRLAATGGTDNFPDVWRDPPPGSARTYARVIGPLTVPAWLDAVRAGRTFGTTGPLLMLTAGGRGPGEELALGATAPPGVRVTATVTSIAPIDRIELVVNGKVAAGMPVKDGWSGSASWDYVIAIPDGGWVAARAVGPASRYVGDSYAFAQTSPVYVVREGTRFVSRDDAAFLLQVVEAIGARATRSSWHSDAERQAFEDDLARARAVYRALSR